MSQDAYQLLAEQHRSRISSQVQSLPTGLHWFCPRQAIDDPGIYFDEDIYTQTGQLPQDRPERHLKRVEEAHARRDLLLEAFEIFAYDSSQAETPQKYIEKALEEQLGRCDICVREFHRSRRRLKQQLMRSVCLAARTMIANVVK